MPNVSISRTVTPVAAVGTRNIVTPSIDERSGSRVRAMTMSHSARVAPEVHSFVPLMRQPESILVARVFMARATSVPPSGSDIENETLVSPRTSCSSTTCCWGVDAYPRSTWMIMNCTMRKAAIDVGPAASSSITTSWSRRSPIPPTSSGASMARTPIAASCS
ncbi:unannotated protein [freshwater metagenome]|uniref:Unannotated protein n=1 Tax=freshwater metagenome TaxID=449393 RepID=A0A6J7RES7_9ZZZZ